MSRKRYSSVKGKDLDLLADLFALGLTLTALEATKLEEKHCADGGSEKFRIGFWGWCLIIAFIIALIQVLVG